MTTVTADILSELKNKLAPFTNSPWAIGVSGGLDSIVLYHAVKEAFPERALHIIHVNHNISPHAKEWEDFVREQALANGERFSSRSVTCSKPTEKEARELRYRAFHDILSLTVDEKSLSHLPTLLLLAHHKDDQIETVLWRFLRGSPIQGLQGMATTAISAPGGSYDLMRPLLEVSKASIRAYAEEHRLNYVNDPSNEDTSYTRNKLRHEAIPALSPHAMGTTQELLRHNFEALKYLLGPYLENPRFIKLSESVLKHKSTLWTVISFWISHYHFEHPSHIELLEYCDQIQKGYEAKLFIGEIALIYSATNSVLYKVPKDIPKSVTITLNKEAPFYRAAWGIYNISMELEESERAVSASEGKAIPKEIEMTIAAISAREKLTLPGRICSAATLWKEMSLPPVLRPYTPQIRLSSGQCLGYGAFETMRIRGAIEGAWIVVSSEPL